jgi:NEDD8-activating enzyme E1 regulatory subunit
MRMGKSELHNIGAFMGGIAAQEAVKLITEQYTPMNNSLVFEGIHSKLQVFQI